MWHNHTPSSPFPPPYPFSYCLAYPFPSLSALVKVEPVVVVAVTASASAAELVSQQFSAICIGFFLAQVVEQSSIFLGPFTCWPLPSFSLHSPRLTSLTFSFVYLPSRVRGFSGVCHQMSLTRFAFCCISSIINTRHKAATTRTTTTTRIRAAAAAAAATCISIISVPTLYTPFTLCWATSAFSFLTVWLSVCSFFLHFHVFLRFRDSWAQRRWKGTERGLHARDCYQCWLNGRHTQGTDTHTHTTPLTQ